MRSIEDIQVRDRQVLVRVDFNVPLDGNQIADDNRIRSSLPTIQFLLDQKAKVILMSHLGKPKGQRVQGLSLAPVAARLGELLGQKVALAQDCIGEGVATHVDQLQGGDVLLLENLRFHSGETANDPEFSRELARWAEVYVNDAFGVAHRSHASVVGVTEHVDVCVPGILFKREVDFLGQALEAPERPFVCIVGGGKVSSKLGVLDKLMGLVDRFIIGGAMANTFRKAQGYNVGQSKVEEGLLDAAREIVDLARQTRTSFYLPVDGILASDPEARLASGICPFQDVPDHKMILDTGPATHTLFAEVLKDARTIVWNGPLGKFENQAFSQGSVGLAQLVAGLEATKIVGGGDTAALIHMCKLTDKYSFISTGGGSFLEFMEGKTLPAVWALKED